MAAAWTGWNKWHISEFLCKRVSTHRHEGEFSSNKAPWHLGSSSWLAVTSTTTSAYILNAARKPAKLNSLPYSYSFSLLFTSVCPFSDWTDCNDKTLKEKKETTDFFFTQLCSDTLVHMHDNCGVQQTSLYSAGIEILSG